MTYMRATQDLRYENNWMCKVILSPGVFSSAFLVRMFDEAFVQDRLADGTLELIEAEEVRCS